jgi:hypothetical protein
VCALVFVASAMATKPASVRIAPTIVPSGGWVHITGIAARCTRGQIVVIVSPVFAGAVKHYLGGKPAIWALVKRGAAFSATVKLASGKPPGTYDVIATCRGTTFAHTLLSVT